jgi:hypothetical protein
MKFTPEMLSAVLFEIANVIKIECGESEKGEENLTGKAAGVAASHQFKRRK